MTAGDILIDVVDAAMEHAWSCDKLECPVCAAQYNQVRLAWKIWKNSRHQRPTPAREDVHVELRTGTR